VIQESTRLKYEPASEPLHVYVKCRVHGLGFDHPLGFRAGKVLNLRTTTSQNVQRFRGGLVFKAHRFFVSLNSRLESNKEEKFRAGCWVEGFKAEPAAEGGGLFIALPLEGRHLHCAFGLRERARERREREARERDNRLRALRARERERGRLGSTPALRLRVEG